MDALLVLTSKNSNQTTEVHQLTTHFAIEPFDGILNLNETPQGSSDLLKNH